MVLAYVIAFAVWKILHNISFPCKSLYLQITAKVSKIMKIVQCDLTFIYIELLEALNSFVEIRLVLEIRNVVSFIKIRFY